MPEKVPLPQPQFKGTMSVEEAIRWRRSRRDFAGTSLSMEQLAQLLWACQGVTGKKARRRAAPSAGATFPIDIFIAIGSATAGRLGGGVYRYVPGEHALDKAFDGDVRQQVAAAAFGQDFLASAPVVILMAAEYARTAGRYGERAGRYVAMEVGHMGQNVYLQAEALGLATVAVGAFHDQQVAVAFRLPKELEPLYLMPVGAIGRS